MLRASSSCILALIATLALVSGSAGALGISGLSVAADGSNTANSSNDTGANRTQVASSIGLVGGAPPPAPDVVGSSVSFDTRYAALVAADREAGGGSTSMSATHSYTITFTVDNPLGGLYQIDIDTSRIGALTLVDDGSGSATASLSALTGLVDGVADPTLGLAAVGPLSGSSGGDQPFSQSSTTLVLLDSAVARTFMLTFTWTSSATGSQGEAAVRLGLGGGLTTTTADNYPGVGGRVAADDGHFVGVVVTLVSLPEPGALVLLAGGLLAIARRPRAPA